MTTLTLGKVKLVNRGAWSSTASYSRGDVVQYNGISYVYKNDTAKSYTALFLGPISGFPLLGTISSLTANTYTFTISWAASLPSTSDARVITNGNLYAYSKFFDAGAKITAITNVSTSQSTVTMSKMSINTTTQSSVPVTIGTRRMANTYEVALNDTDWDQLSEGFVYAGDWNSTTNYIPGQLVVRNNNSYQCLAGNVGIDPLFDYAGVWDPYLVGNEGLPHERALSFPNANPHGWRGHPYVPKPTWGNASTINATAMKAGGTYTIVTQGTTDYTTFGATSNAVGTQFVATAVGTGTGTVAKTYSGIPWNIPASHQSNYFAPVWNTGNIRAYMAYRGEVDFNDAGGNRLTKGNAYYWHGVGGSGNKTFVGEFGPMFNNDYLSDDAPVHGNKPFSKTFGIQRPAIVQATHSWSAWGTLMSNGQVMWGGNSSDGALGNGQSDDAGNAMLPLGKDKFGGRAIVKIGSAGYSRDGSQGGVALDEYGELWTWGYNGLGECGTGPEPWQSIQTGYENADMGWVSTPFCLQKDLHFGGARIVDFWRGNHFIWAMDENGDLWSWGRNGYGQLGYPTASGFSSTDRSRAPYKIPVTWSSVGGVQKVFLCSHEDYDYVYVLDGQGHVWNCGFNGSGQLGRGTSSSDGTSSTIIRASSTYAWTAAGAITNIWANQIEEGAGTAAFFFTDSTVISSAGPQSNGNYRLWGCGYGGHYSFDAAGTSVNSTPVLLYGPNGIMTDIVTFNCVGRSGGGHHACLDINGNAYMTGWNGYGAAAVGHDSYVSPMYGYNRHLQYGQVTSGSASSGGSTWARVLHPNAIGKLVDIWGYGDYDGPAGHNPMQYFLTERGELLMSGRGYNYSFYGYGDVYTMMNQTNFV
jgi:alpha-tubulin suppressor-like RCC1 family protein